MLIEKPNEYVWFELHKALTKHITHGTKTMERQLPKLLCYELHSMNNSYSKMIAKSCHWQNYFFFVLCYRLFAEIRSYVSILAAGMNAICKENAKILGRTEAAIAVSCRFSLRFLFCFKLPIAKRHLFEVYSCFS